MDAIATLEGLNLAGVPAAAVSRGVGYIQAQQLVTYPQNVMRQGLSGFSGGVADFSAASRQSCRRWADHYCRGGALGRSARDAFHRGGCGPAPACPGVSGFRGFGAPEFTPSATPTQSVETGRAVICQATTAAEVAKREAVALDRAAKAAAKQGDADKAAMLGREADRKAEVAVAATEKAAKAAVVVEAAKQEAALMKQAAIAQAKGDAPKAAVLVAAAQEARKQQAEVQAAPSLESMTCKCPGVMPKGGGLSGVLAGLGFKIGVKTLTDIKGKIEAAQAEAKGAAKQITKGGWARIAKAAKNLPVGAPGCPDCPPAQSPVETASMLPGGVLPWLGGAVVLALVAKKFMK